MYIYFYPDTTLSCIFLTNDIFRVKQILQVLSIFNFNIDLAAPECIIPEFDYKVKWIIMMLLPLIFAAVLLLTFIAVSCVKAIKHVGRCSGKATKYWSHANKLIAMYAIVFYFIYLTVTRRALDILNCNPPDPPDGYSYTEFTSIECAGGACVCNDPTGLQQQLAPYAYMGFIVYSLGFPLFVWYITWYYRIQIKLDQLLRAHGLGDTRETSATGIRFTPRRCRSRLRDTYEIRKKYHKLYYHFKPGKVYWMLVILIRKLLIAVIALLFRANVAFLLSCVLMVLFASYVLQIKHKPYMSTVEREEVKLTHRMKAAHAEELLSLANTMNAKIPADALLHHELAKSIKRLKQVIALSKHRERKQSIRNLDAAAKITTRNAKLKKEERMKDYYFDYNTVEQVLIMCSIVLALVAIMFESSQFYVTDRISGISKLSTDPETMAYYNVILVMASIVLFGSLLYYFTVLLAEVMGHVPQFVRVLCAGKKSHAQKHLATVGADGGVGDQNIDDDIEMSDVGNMAFRNPMVELEEAKQQIKANKIRERQLEAQNREHNDNQQQLLNQMKKLKQQNRVASSKNKRPTPRRAARNMRTEMAPRKVHVTLSPGQRGGTATRAQTTATTRGQKTATRGRKRKSGPSRGKQRKSK